MYPLINHHRRLQPGQEQSRWKVPGPKPLSAPITSMRVTEFKTNLGCPYGITPQRAEVGGLDDSAEEVGWSNVRFAAHEVLSALGKDPGVAAGNAEAIARNLDANSTRPCSRTSASALASILVQVEQLRRRLAALARCRPPLGRPRLADRARRGQPAAGKASLLVDGRPMFLAAASIRIDVQEASGKRMIFDYKTSDGAKSPRKAHRKKSGEWIDLPTALVPAPRRAPGDRRPRRTGLHQPFPKTSPPWGTWRPTGRRTISPTPTLPRPTSFAA